MAGMGKQTRGSGCAKGAGANETMHYRTGGIVKNPVRQPKPEHMMPDMPMQLMPGKMPMKGKR